MAILTKDQILQAADIQTETVAVPEWGGEVLVRGLTEEERDRYEDGLSQVRGKKVTLTLQNARARLVAMAIVGEDGKRLFSDRDVEALGKKSGQALERVFDVARRMAGLSGDDVEELQKNLPGGQSDVSISD